MPDVIDPELTPAWLAVYEAIRQAWLDFGSAPAQSELMRACAVSSITVQNAFHKLRANGHITYQKSVPRSAKPVDIYRRLYKTAPDPWAELEETKFWKS